MKLEVYPNLTGLRGTERTIAHMRRLVESGKTDPRVVLQAHKIVKGIDRNDWTKMASAIFKFVHDRIAYVRDPVGVEFVKSPAITLQTKTGDCDDQAVLFSTLAESVGMKTRFKAVKADPKYPSEFSHVYSQVEIPGRGWVSADTIVPGAQFGWEARGFAGRTWGGMSGMSFITMGDVGALGDAKLAAGSVSYDEDELDTTFGDPFGEAENAPEPAPDTGGSMWLNTPMLVGPEESEINTIVDADEDHWGGSTDLEPGPGLKSRMLPPGVGALNVLALRGSDLGRLKLFKKITDAVKKVTKKVTTGVKKGFEDVGKGIAKAVGLSTPESRQAASRKAVNQILGQIWNSDGIQYGLEVLRRAQEIVAAVRSGKTPPYIQGPPPGSAGSGMSGYVRRRGMGRLGQMDVKAITQKALESTPWGSAISTASNLLKGIGQAEDAKAANAAVKKYVEQFPQDDLKAAIEKASGALLAVGGILPVTGEKPSEDWVAAFRAQTRAGVQKDGGDRGYTYYDMVGLISQLKAVVPEVQAVKTTLAAASKAADAVAGAGTIQVSAEVVKKAVESGDVKTSEIEQALALTKKTAMGYSLTPEEQELAARIASGARKQQPASGVGKALAIGLPAAAAAAAFLL